LGLALLALDLPLLRGPVARAIIWGRRKAGRWLHRKRPDAG